MLPFIFDVIDLLALVTMLCMGLKQLLFQSMVIYLETIFFNTENKTYTGFKCISQFELFFANVFANINIIAVYKL